MNENNRLARHFEENRPHLRGVAFRMLASASDADDAVQEAWLRLSRNDASEVQNLRAWLTTVVARVSLDMLRSLQARGEEALDAPLAESLVDERKESDPEREVELADSVGVALLVVLDKLSPSERLAFVLHDTFGLPFGEIAPGEIAPIVGCSVEAARQRALFASGAGRWAGWDRGSAARTFAFGAALHPGGRQNRRNRDHRRPDATGAVGFGSSFFLNARMTLERAPCTFNTILTSRAPPEEKRSGKDGVYRSVLVELIWSLDTLCKSARCTARRRIRAKARGLHPK